MLVVKFFFWFQVFKLSVKHVFTTVPYQIIEFSEIYINITQQFTDSTVGDVEVEQPPFPQYRAPAVVLGVPERLRDPHQRYLLLRPVSCGFVWSVVVGHVRLRRVSFLFDQNLFCGFLFWNYFLKAQTNLLHRAFSCNWLVSKTVLTSQKKLPQILYIL